ncbi:hypothetical protein [Pseudomonas sp. URMO17WK12:I2]|uniref:hypothetical protein n=1 Tax=Pseudomonas sp. URMO17WK12:I2 TaxID=1261623 RepID=UPI000DAEA75D|nr:hypothetical protein [Pseudomonas sp. URMO17WK12:I2]PZW49690.1 hypothetical protein F469_00494 [Pseudomonas sp. URMO17WK12:I2]
MQTEVSPQRISAELKSIIKPNALIAGLDGFPYKDLDDREFEILIYSLLKDEITRGEVPDVSKVSLMQGVGERGRDIILYSSHGVAGVVQCKKLAKRLDKPAAYKEIIKYILHCILDESLVSTSGQTEYHMYAPGGLTEQTQKLFDSPEVTINADLANGLFEKQLLAVINFYEAFQGFQVSPPLARVADELKKLKLLKHDANDLDVRLAHNSRVAAAFFRTKVYVEKETIAPVLEELLNTFGEKMGLKLLTDEHLIEVQERISKIHSSKRVSFGHVDIFGYDRELYAYFSNEEFEEFLKRIEAVRQFFNVKALSVITEKVMSLMYEKITIPLVHEDRIRPITVVVVGQYLVRVIIPIFMRGAMTSEAYHKKYGSSEVSLDIVVGEIVSSIMKFLAGDYSNFPNPDPSREMRISHFVALSAGISSEADALEIISEDMLLLKPIVDEIITEVSGIADASRTIIIKDTSIMSDADAIRKVSDELDSLQIGKGTKTSFFDSLK